MELATYQEGHQLQIALAELKKIKIELATPATQAVVVLLKRKLPPAPPASLTTALDTVEDFLVAQAVTAIDDQITSLQTSFDNLQDP